MFNSRVSRQQGASEMTVASGGSLNVLAGGLLSVAGTLAISGDQTITAGSQILSAGTLFTVQAGASVTIVSTVSGTGFRFDIGGSTPSIGAGGNVPTHTAVPGSVYLRAAGSVSGVYWNFGQDTASSQWRLAASG